MNKLITLLAFLLSFASYSQSPEGTWYGELNVYGNKLPLVVKIEGQKKKWTGDFLSPNQSDKATVLTNITFKKKMLAFDTETGGAKYLGKVSEAEITGQFTQNGLSFPLILTKNKPKSTRPQTPKEPFAYHSEEVEFENKTDGITLKGTFTRPKNEDKFPVVVLISGSGPQDRNSNILGHKSFMVIADALSSNGIAVLRFDDRGTAESEGDFSLATTFDFAEDVKSAIDYLRTRSDIDTSKMGLIGHSEGGVVAPLVASTRSDVSFVILMAGPGVTGAKVLLKQQELILSKSGIPATDLKSLKTINTRAYTIVEEAEDLKEQKEKLNEYYLKEYPNYPTVLMGGNMSKEQFANTQTNAISSPWMRAFLLLDPAEALQSTHCPVLAINGTIDLQVDAEQNLTSIEKVLNKANNPSVTIKRFEGLNHLFQKSETGLPNDYGKIEQTISPDVLATMKDWIIKTTK
jgi:alpha/beta superfamily hydrolase